MPHPPEPNWFRSRVDLRQVRRIEKTLVAISLNGLFLAWAFGLGPLQDERGSQWLCLGALAISLGSLISRLLFAKNQVVLRRFADDQGARLGLSGTFTETRYFRGELELGRDMGWLGLDGAMLRFKGARTRFAIAQFGRAAFLDSTLRSRAFVVDADGIPVTVQVRAVGDAQEDLIAVLRRWPTQGTTDQPEKMPPTTADARTRWWYAQRAMETTPGFGLLGLAILLQNIVPRSLVWLRVLVLIATVAGCATWLAVRARRLRQRDENLLAETFTSPLKARSPENRVLDSEEAPRITA